MRGNQNAQVDGTITRRERSRPICGLRSQITAAGTAAALCLLATTGASAQSASLAGQNVGGGTAAGSVVEIADASAAVHLIDTLGSFAQVDGQSATSGGSGTGFVVSPDGLMVTNNHVVAGASIIEVYLPGLEHSVNAPVLGYSECHDLAVLDLPLDDLPFLTWSEEPVVAGQTVVAAGYPDGDPRFALINGNVIRAPGPGATPWSSIDLEIEHTAPTRPGSSGGPLLDASGAVVGIHYAGSVDGFQHWAISALEAREVVDELAKGRNVASIGLNGEAVTASDDAPAGIFVSSVVPGSPADRVGIQGGDVITSVNGIAVATDGTMATYCSVLRSHSARSTLDIEVLRASTGETLTGQINGDPLTALESDPSTEPETGTTDDVTGDELALREHIPSAILETGTCVTSDDGDFPRDALASVECEPAAVADHVWYDAFRSKAEMNAYYKSLWSGKVKAESGKCPSGAGEGEWTVDDRPGGRVACWVKEGVAWMTWTDNDLLILTTARQSPVKWSPFREWWANEAGPFR